MIPLSELKKKVVTESMVEIKTLKKSFGCKSKPVAVVTRTFSGERSII